MLCKIWCHADMYDINKLSLINEWNRKSISIPSISNTMNRVPSAHLCMFFFKLLKSNCSIAMLFNNIIFWKTRLFYDVTFCLLLLSSVLLLLTTWDMYDLTSKIVKFSTCLKTVEWWKLKHMTKCYIHMHFKWIYMS